MIYVILIAGLGESSKNNKYCLNINTEKTFYNYIFYCTGGLRVDKQESNSTFCY